MRVVIEDQVGVARPAAECEVVREGRHHLPEAAAVGVDDVDARWGPESLLMLLCVKMILRPGAHLAVSLSRARVNRRSSPPPALTMKTSLLSPSMNTICFPSGDQTG